MMFKILRTDDRGNHRQAAVDFKQHQKHFQINRYFSEQSDLRRLLPYYIAPQMLDFQGST